MSPNGGGGAMERFMTSRLLEASGNKVEGGGHGNHTLERDILPKIENGQANGQSR